MARIPKNLTVKELNRLQTSQLTAAQRSRIARLVQNPATRRLLETRFLPAGQRQQRQLNERLNAPIVPGSTTTNRELARQRKTAVQVRYGGEDVEAANQLAASQQQATDVGSWYDQYQNSLRQYAANVQGIGQRAQQGAQALAQAVPNLGQGTIDYMRGQQQAQQAVTGGVPSGEAAAAGDQASALRTALAASFGAQLLQSMAANQGYAENLAGPVAGAQALQARAQAAGRVNLARKAVGDLAGEKGAYGAQYEQQRRQQEGTELRALQVANVKEAGDVKQERIKAAAKVTTERTKAATKRREQAAKAAERAAKLNKYGFTTAEWNALPESEKKKYRTGAIKPKTSKPGSGPGSITPAQEQKYVAQINKVLSWLQTPPNWPGGPRAGKPMTAAEVYNSLKRGGTLSGGSPIDPRILDVARSLYHNKGTGLGAFGVSKAHDLGLRVQGRWKVVK